ncbi:hypothetical protein [Jiella pacifica]|nr:hypothetical protein [Jiella pacifica]
MLLIMGIGVRFIARVTDVPNWALYSAIQVFCVTVTLPPRLNPV